ncbi:MAG: hypothetical protein ACN6NM_01765, partial [Acinetobacter bohemicus]
HVTTHLMRSLSKARVQLYDAAICTFDCANMNGRLLGSLWLLDKLSKQAVSVNVFSVSFPLL